MAPQPDQIASTSNANSSTTQSSDTASTLIFSWTTTLTSEEVSGATLSGLALLPISTLNGSVSTVPWTTILSTAYAQGAPVSGLFAAITTTNPTASSAINTATAPSSPTGSGSAKKPPGTLSRGAAAGIAIATAIIGALLAAGVLIMLQKKRSKKTRKEHGFASFTSSSRQSEKHAAKGGAFVSEQPDFDLDRLFPQPLDDATVKGKAQSLFEQIDSHVESFYIDSDIAASALQAGGGGPGNQMLLDPTSRLFMIKKIICETALASIGMDCPSETSFLPCRFPSLTRQLKESNIADHASALSWSRLRTSFAFLLRPDSNTEQTRLNQAVSTVVDKLNQQLQPFEMPGSTAKRLEDLMAICRSAADLGRILLAQPAIWQFEWTETSAGGSRGAAQGSGPRLVYSPALVRLTDNKARKLQSPNIMLQAKTMR